MPKKVTSLILGPLARSTLLKLSSILNSALIAVNVGNAHFFTQDNFIDLSLNLCIHLQKGITVFSKVDLKRLTNPLKFY